jgi:hypothetical protein
MSDEKRKEATWVTIPLSQISPPHTKVAISLPELERQTNAFSTQYRPGCEAKLLSSSPKELYLHYNVTCHKKDSNPLGHDVQMQFDLSKVKETTKAQDLDVKCSCSCEAWLYWGAQWNTHQRDALLGIPRPKLVAPTERLDLRANFILCKHVATIAERVLPSVQHNIVKILREQEMKKKKDEEQKTPERLLREQERMRKRKEIEKIRQVKNKKIKDQLLEALRKEEEKRMLHEQELDELSGVEPEETTEAEPEDKTPEPPPEAKPKPRLVDQNTDKDEIHDIEELLWQEEQKMEEKHVDKKPHLHVGLPYDIEHEDHDIDDLSKPEEKDEEEQE